jgi:hypothetical protein
MSSPLHRDKGGSSRTQQAIEEAMKAYDGKEASAASRADGRQVYTIRRGKAPVAAAAPIPTSSSSPAAAKPALTTKQWKTIAAVAGAMVLLFIGYLVFAPSAYESEHGIDILQAKQDGDQLLNEGKPVEAFKKYEKVILMSANQTFHNGRVRDAVQGAREARTKLFPEVKEAEHQAQLARHTQ